MPGGFGQPNRGSRTEAARTADLETHISTEDGFGGHNRACSGLGSIAAALSVGIQ
jgi:hypothetical protein